MTGTISDGRKKLEALSLQAFCIMPRLWQPSDILRVSGAPTYSRYTFHVQYKSKKYSTGGDSDTIYNMTIDTDQKILREENVMVNPVYWGRGFGRELVGAKHRLLKKLGFEEAPVVDMLGRSKGFWEHMGYKENEDGDMAFDLRCLGE